MLYMYFTTDLSVVVVVATVVYSLIVIYTVAVPTRPPVSVAYASTVNVDLEQAQSVGMSTCVDIIPLEPPI